MEYTVAFGHNKYVQSSGKAGWRLTDSIKNGSAKLIAGRGWQPFICPFRQQGHLSVTSPSREQLAFVIELLIRKPLGLGLS